MPTYLEQLTTTRDQVAANLAAITVSPKPDYTIDGQTVSWQALFESYMEQLAALEARIAAAAPFEEHSQGFT